MKNQYLRVARSGITFLAFLFFLFISSMIIGQTLDIPPGVGSFTDDVKPNYNGWNGNPAKIQVYGAPPVNQDSLQEACNRWNNAGGNPQLEVTNKKEEAEVTVAIDPGLNPGAGKCSYEYYPSGYSSAKITINPGTPPNCGETELITHELGHALGLADTDYKKNPDDSMRDTASNGKGGNLSKHDSAEIKAASALNVSRVAADAPPMAFAPGMYAIAQFPLSQPYPPEIASLAIISVVPVGDPDIVILGANVSGDHLSVNLQVLPDHWSGQFYLNIHIEFPPPYEAVSFMGWHYVNSTPVPPTIFDCPFVVSTLPDNSIMIEWESTCTYPYPGENLRSILTINNYVGVNNKGNGPYILALPSGTYTITLTVDDFQGNSATSLQIITVSNPGEYNIPSPGFPTIASAIAFLNGGIIVPPGGVTFLVDANYVETGVNLVLNTTSGSASTPITFKKHPYQSGSNPNLTVAAGGAGLTDGGIIIAGTDYVTFTEIDIDASAQPTVEWGYALVKRQNVAPFDGCQNVTINGCNIKMNRLNQSSVGIYSGNHTATSTTALVITATSDAHNYCSFNVNTIDNAYNGIYIRGYNAGTPYDLYDHYNSVGVDGKNIITNFGGAAGDAYGIYVQYQDMIKIMNDSIISAPGSTGRVAGIATTGGVGSSIEIGYNEISVTSSGVGLKNLYGIWNNLGSGNTTNTIEIHHNIIKNCTFPTATTGPMYGILNTANPNLIKIYNNEIYGSVYPGTSSNNHAINCGASGSIARVYDNYIHNMTTTGTNNLTLIIVSSFSTIDVYGNIIENCSANGGVTCGIQSGTCATLNAYKNKISGLSSSGTSGMVYGINNVGASTANIFNNYISELTAGSSLANPAVIGLNLNGGTTTNVFYNTVYLDQSVAGSTSFGSCALYSGTTPLTTLANNILVNVSTPGATGYTVAHRRSTTNLTTYSPNSNNNNFYAGIPGPNNLIFYDGTTPVPTLPAYQALVAPRDVAAFSENPPFVNTLLSPYNLHLQTGVTTLCESGGTVATAPLVIADDFDGEPRFPDPGYPDNPFQPATAPDVGADEFAGGPTPRILHIKAYLEGLYLGIGEMRTAYDETGPHWPPHVADHVTIELHNAIDYTIVEHILPDLELTTTGDLNASMNPAINGIYYITIKHRNSIETTSSIAVDFSLTPNIDYNFDLPSRAYGNNLKTMPDGQVVIYTGDPNHDGLVDGSDMNDIGNQNDIFATGYLDEDINGDGLVDGSDLNMTSNNNDLFVRSITP